LPRIRAHDTCHDPLPRAPSHDTCHDPCHGPRPHDTCHDPCHGPILRLAASPSSPVRPQHSLRSALSRAIGRRNCRPHSRLPIARGLPTARELAAGQLARRTGAPARSSQLPGGRDASTLLATARGPGTRTTPHGDASALLAIARGPGTRTTPHGGASTL